MEFREKLRRLARDHNLSAREIGERAKVASHSTVNRWLLGASDPRLSEVARVAGVFGVPVAYLADDNINDPRAVGSANHDPAASKMTERFRALGVEQAMAVLEAAEQLGADRAALILKVACVLGYEASVSRLTLRGVAQAGEELRIPHGE